MTYTVQFAGVAGYTPVANTDAGFTTANGTALAIPTPPASLGMTIQGTDPTYGTGEFICLLGVAGTAVGSLVIWDATTYQTTLCPSTANLARPVAVAMSACLAVNYGWYQIAGSAVVLKSTNHNIQPNVAVGVYSTGKIATTSSSGNGKEILGARFTAAATAASSATTAVIVINQPHLEGRTT